MIAAIDKIPAGARRLPSSVLAHGEITGHSHRVETSGSAEIWQIRDMLFMRVVTDSAAIVHEEHKRITIPRGIYRVWQQREYTPTAIVRVMD
jgi:hypothetical protein